MKEYARYGESKPVPVSSSSAEQHTVNEDNRTNRRKDKNIPAVCANRLLDREWHVEGGAGEGTSSQSESRTPLVTVEMSPVCCFNQQFGKEMLFKTPKCPLDFVLLFSKVMTKFQYILLQVCLAIRGIILLVYLSCSAQQKQ